MGHVHIIGIINTGDLNVYNLSVHIIQLLDVNIINYKMTRMKCTQRISMLLSLGDFYLFILF